MKAPGFDGGGQKLLHACWRRLWKDPQILPTLRRVVPAPVRSTAIWFGRKVWKLWRGLVVEAFGNSGRFGLETAVSISKSCGRETLAAG